MYSSFCRIHLRILNLLRMASFLPKLTILVDLMLELVVA